MPTILIRLILNNMKEELIKLTAKFGEISGQWKGKESGIAEDRAMAAIDGIEHIKELIEIIDFLNEY